MIQACAHNVVFGLNIPQRQTQGGRVNQFGLVTYISFQPFVPSAELWNHLQTYGLLAQICDFEGLSKIALETMVRGLPGLVSEV